MSTPKFIISTDSSADLYKSTYRENNIHYLVMKRILNGREIGEVYDSAEEFDQFYDELKNGAMPTTTQLNTYEFEEYFRNLLQAEKEGDIIHIPLSSGISGTCDNARATAEELNKGLSGRKIYIVDSLLASAGIAMLIDKLIAMRDAGVETSKAVEHVLYVRDRQQIWIHVNDLFHLRRGGRISGVKAAIGTLLNIKPVLILNRKGKLVIEHTTKGGHKAVSYLMGKIDKFGAQARPDFIKNPIYLLRSSPNDRYDLLKKELTEKYPEAIIKESIIGPIIGTHLGCGCTAVLFEGAERLDL